jgi:hypothetical protein
MNENDAKITAKRLLKPVKFMENKRSAKRYVLQPLAAKGHAHSSPFEVGVDTIRTYS